MKLLKMPDGARQPVSGGDAADAVKRFAELWRSGLFDCGPQDYEFMVRESIAALEKTRRVLEAGLTLMRKRSTPTYLLRLYDYNDLEVGTSTVAVTAQGQNYPAVGQTIDDTWEVVTVISQTPAETRLRVKKINQAVR